MVEVKKRIRIILALTIIAIITGCGEKNTYVPPPPPKVTVSRPLSKPVTDYLDFTGNVVAFNTVPLKARVEGYLEKILFQDGQPVKKGKLLFLLQQDQYTAQLQQAQAALLAEKAQLEHAQTEYVRYSNLLKEDAAAQTDVDRWKYQRDSKRAAVMAAQAQVELAKLNLSYTRITAPFDGRMGRHQKDVGTLVGAGEPTLLAEINQIDPIYVYFNINEQDLLRVRKKGSPEEREKIPVFVGLANETGYPHEGGLDFAGISLNPSTGSLQLRGILRNPGAILYPGLFARVRVPVAEAKNALLVPETAISYDQVGPFLRVVNDKNVVERRGIKLGNQVNDDRVILEGLHENDWLVTAGLMRAIPGRPVTPEREGAVPKTTGAGEPGARKAGP